MIDEYSIEDVNMNKLARGIFDKKDNIRVSSNNEMTDGYGILKPQGNRIIYTNPSSEDGKEVDATKAELASAQAAKDATEAELATLQASYDEVSKKLADLEATRAKMEAHIKDLQTTQEQLQNGIIHLREGTILFQVDQLLAQAVVRPGLSEEDSHAAIKNIIDDTNKLVLRRLGIEDQGQAVVYVERQKY